MKGQILIGAGLVLAMAAAATPALAEGNANFVLGGRALGENDWSPVEEQGVVGVTVDFGKESWPVHLVAGLMASRGEDESMTLDFDGKVSEISFGVLKIWEIAGGKMRPFIGGGLAAVSAEVEVESFGTSLSVDDKSGAFYAQGGIFWRIGSRFNLGVDARVLRGSDFQIGDDEGSADYEQLGLLLGWGWPAE